MIVISGAILVLPDRVVDDGSVVIDGDRISAIETRRIDAPEGATYIDGRGALVVPGFIDVHVHGVEGVDVLDGPGAVATVASRLPRYGVTAFCPTTVACVPAMLDTMLSDVAEADGAHTNAIAARVLPAHLESNFINPEYKGAQPLACIRTPTNHRASQESSTEPRFAGSDILAVIARRRDYVGIVTLAPEIEGGMDLVSALSAAGHRVSIGHTGATYEQAVEAIAAGVCHATHLFNRMPPMTHRAPGVPGAVLQSETVAAELICDGFHVHPSLLRVAIRAKGVSAVMAISDGTAGSGLPVGSRTRLGGRPIVVTERTAELEDGTLAGSVLTMDAAFRVLVGKVGLSVIEAARLCATTSAEQLKLRDMGRIAVGGLADLVILDRETLRVRATLIAGRVWASGLAAP
jgi:N-acetylglucosamine-6-phosphate deacetylase